MTLRPDRYLDETEAAVDGGKSSVAPDLNRDFRLAVNRRRSAGRRSAVPTSAAVRAASCQLPVPAGARLLRAGGYLRCSHVRLPGCTVRVPAGRWGLDLRRGHSLTFIRPPGTRARNPDQGGIQN